MSNIDDHDFFEIVAGSKSGQQMAEAVRDALKAEAETIKLSNVALQENLSEHERAVSEAIKIKLIEAGVFKQNKLTQSSWLSRFSDLFKFNFTNQNWGAGFAVAASVTILCVILVKRSENGSDASIKLDVAAADSTLSDEYSQVDQKSAETQAIQKNSPNLDSPVDNKAAPNTKYANNNDGQKLTNTPLMTAEQNTESLNATPQSVEPDANNIEEKILIAGNTENTEVELKPEPNTQTTTDAKPPFTNEKYETAQNTSPRDLNSILKGKITGLYSPKKSDKEKAKQRQTSNNPIIVLPPQNVFSILNVNPDKKAERLRESFSAIGADVKIAKSNDDEWVIEISVPDMNVDAVKNLMVDEGFYQKGIDSNPPYTIRIVRKK